MGRLEQWMEKRSCNFWLSFSWDWLLFLALQKNWVSIAIFALQDWLRLVSFESQQSVQPRSLNLQIMSHPTFRSQNHSKTMKTYFMNPHIFSAQVKKLFPIKNSTFQHIYDNKKHQNTSPTSQKNHLDWCRYAISRIKSKPQRRPGTWFTKDPVGFSTNLWKNPAQVVKLDHEIPQIGVNIPKNSWVATTKKVK